MPMYNLLKQSSNHSNTACSLWLYSIDEANNFNNDYVNITNFKSFTYKAKSLGNTEANGLNEILRNIAIAKPLNI